MHLTAWEKGLKVSTVFTDRTVLQHRLLYVHKPPFPTGLLTPPACFTSRRGTLERLTEDKN